MYNLVSGTTSSSQSFDCMGGSCEEMYKKETERTFAEAEMGDYATCTYFLVPAIHENQFHVSLHLEGLLSREDLHLQYACHGPGNGQRFTTTLHAQMFALSRHAPTPDGPRCHTPPPQQAITAVDESFYAKLFGDIELLSNAGPQLELGGIEDMLVKVSQGRQGSAQGLASMIIKFSSLRSSLCKVAAGIEMAVVYALVLRRPRWLPRPSHSRPHSHSVAGCGRYASWTFGLRRTRRGRSRGSATRSG